MLSLLVTDQQKRIAKTNKNIGMVFMDPWDFLFLTVRGSVDQWLATTKSETQTLEMYNEWSRRGEIRIIPFLSVDKDTGMVLAHEGRHRAAALVDRKINLMPVCVSLRIRGHLEYYVEPFGDDITNPRRFWKRYLGKQDIPRRFLGQFDRTSVDMVNALKNWEGFYTDLETRLPITAGNRMVKVGK